MVLVYGVWWIALLLVLWPTPRQSAADPSPSRSTASSSEAPRPRHPAAIPLIVWGGAFFLASDTVLAFRLFMPDAMPDWTSPLVMITYCLGQGLIAAGVVVSTDTPRAAQSEVARA